MDRSASSPGAMPAGGVPMSKILSRNVMEPLPCIVGSVVRFARVQMYGAGVAPPAYTRKVPLPTVVRDGAVGATMALEAGTVKLQPDDALASWVWSPWWQ